MATTCPQCGQSLDQDFGVVSCPQCHAVLVFDLDGNVEIQEASVMSQEIHDASESEEPIITEPVEFLVEEGISEEIFTPEEISIPDEVIAQEPIQPEEPFIGEPTVPLVNTSGAVISYHLKIEGIDTKDMRIQVEEALEDAKFPWTAREIIRQTKDGILEIGPMNPVVASVLVRRLKDVSVNISWRQNIYEN